MIGSTWRLAISGLVGACLLAGLAPAAPRGNEYGKPVTFGLIGDIMYGQQQIDDAQRLIADMNAADLDFVVHTGDITYAPVEHPRCSRATLRYNLEHIILALDYPVVYTPGDNEWADCPGYVGEHDIGTGDPLQALSNIRHIFFGTPFALGEEDPFRMQVQSQRFPENRRFTVAGVPIATLHVVGSLNGYEWVALAPKLAETIPDRQAANRRWLRKTFKYAERIDAPGVMLIWHGDPDPYTNGFWSTDSPVRPPLWDDAYAQLLHVLRTEVKQFGKPVVLVHGDSHFFRIDKPLPRKPGGEFSLPNFSRVETFGAPNHHWVRATIDPAGPKLFEFEPMIVPGNRRPPEQTQ